MGLFNKENTMSLKRLLVADATVSAAKKGMASVLESALTKPSSANSSAKGKEKQELKKGAIGK